VVSIIITVAIAGVPKMCPLLIESIETLNSSSSSNILSSFIVTFNEATVDPVGSIRVFGPE